MNPACSKLRTGVALVMIGATTTFAQVDGWRPSTRYANTAVKTAAQSGQERAETRDIDELLGWLPLDTESVIFARGPYPQPEPDSLPQHLANANVATESRVVNGKTRNVLVYVDPQTGQELGLVHDPSNDRPRLRLDTIERAVIAFRELGPAYTEQIQQHPIKATLAAARRFGPLTGIPGGTPYEGCHIIVFDAPFRAGPINETLSQLDRIKIGQTDVISLHTEWGEKKVVLYFAHPKANVLVAATDRDFLTMTLARILQRGPSRALPSDLPEWKHVNVESAVWGVRHVHNANVKQAAVRRSDKYGVTFSFDEQQAMVVVRYFSTLEPPNRRLSILAQAIIPDDHQPIRSISRDVAEVRFCDNSESFSGLVTEALMGWVIAL